MAALVFPVRDSQGRVIVESSTIFIDYPGSVQVAFERSGARLPLISNTGVWRGSLTVSVADKNDLEAVARIESVLAAMQVGGVEIYVPILKKQTMPAGVSRRVASSEPHAYGVKVNLSGSCMPGELGKNYFVQIGQRVFQVYEVERDENRCAAAIVVNPAVYPLQNDLVQGVNSIVARQAGLKPDSNNNGTKWT